MSNKTKTVSESFTDVAKNFGYLVMASAATFGMLELPDHLNTRIAVPNQPAFALANVSTEEQGNNINREREEVAPHYISFGEVQRSAARSGKQ